MARDILAAPISTIDSESAFSTGRRVLDEYRSSLTSKMVQSLICTQDWLQGSPRINEIEEDQLQLDKVDLGRRCIEHTIFLRLLWNFQACVVASLFCFWQAVLGNLSSCLL